MHNTSRIIPSILCIAWIPVLFQGCATSSDGRKAQTQGTVIGAVAGGALGFVVGSVLSDGDGAVAGTVIGAAAGGALGYALGTSIAKRKEKYATAEAWLQQELVLAKQANTQVQGRNKAMSDQLSALELRAKKAHEQGQPTELAAVKKEIGKLKSESNKQAAEESRFAMDIKEVLADNQAKLASADYAAYKQQAAMFDHAISERGTLLNRLASLDSSLDH